MRGAVLPPISPAPATDAADERAEPEQRADESGAPAVPGRRGHRRAVAALATVALLAGMAAVITLITRRDHGPSPPAAQPAAGSPSVPVSPPLAPLPTLPTLPAAVRSDCPAATPARTGNAADLPQLGVTARAAVEQVAARGRAAILTTYPGATDVQVVPRAGQVWDGINGFAFRIVEAEDFQLQVLLGAVADCPRAPTTYQRIPVLFTVAPPRATPLDAAVVLTGVGGGSLAYPVGGGPGQPFVPGPLRRMTGRAGRRVLANGALVTIGDPLVISTNFPAAFPSAFGDSVWGYSGNTVQELDLDGNALGPPASLPAGSVLVSPPRAVVDGLLVASAGILSVWDPASGTLVARLGPVQSVTGTFTDVAAGTSLVAWVPLGCTTAQGGGRFCDLTVTHLPAGSSTGVAAPSGTLGFVGGGGFSPDGSQLAAFVYTARVFAQDPRAGLVLVDTRTAALLRVAGSDVAIGEPDGYASWTPDGTTVFFGGLETYVRRYRVGDLAATVTTIPSSYDVLVAPAPS